MSEWISVKDRLPEEDEFIFIASVPLDEVDFGVYVDRGDGTKAFKNPYIGYYIYPQITHWMPLPKPPKEL